CRAACRSWAVTNSPVVDSASSTAERWLVVRRGALPMTIRSLTPSPVPRPCIPRNPRLPAAAQGAVGTVKRWRRPDRAPSQKGAVGGRPSTARSRSDRGPGDDDDGADELHLRRDRDLVIPVARRITRLGGDVNRTHTADTEHTAE